MPTANTDKLERDIEQFFFRRIRLVGGHTIKLAPIEKGTPDRLVMLLGHMYLVELKRKGEDTTAIQKHWHKKVLERCGIEVVVLHGQEEILRWVRRIVNAAGPQSKYKTDDDPD